MRDKQGRNMKPSGERPRAPAPPIPQLGDEYTGTEKIFGLTFEVAPDVNADLLSVAKEALEIYESIERWFKDGVIPRTMVKAVMHGAGDRATAAIAAAEGKAL